jgi:hypothetical protein
MTYRPCLALLAVCAVTTGCLFSPSRGFCQAAGECDDDNASVFLGGFDIVGPSDDSIEVCVAQQDGFLRQLRANEEKACHEAADACDGLRSPAFNSNPCDDELDDFQDALRDADGDCSANEE